MGLEAYAPSVAWIAALAVLLWLAYVSGSEATPRGILQNRRGWPRSVVQHPSEGGLTYRGRGATYIVGPRQEVTQFLDGAPSG
jgi:hypothetical protein